MAHIVVLGAGLGGTPLAFELRHLLGREHRITVVSDHPTFHFTPYTECYVYRNSSFYQGDGFG